MEVVEVDDHEGRVGVEGEWLLNCSTGNLECLPLVWRKKREQRRDVEEGE